jgi:hypothetical protein
VDGRWYLADGSFGEFRVVDTSAANDGSSFSGPAWWGDVRTETTAFVTFNGARVGNEESFSHEDAFFTTSSALLSGSYYYEDEELGEMRYEVDIERGV